ncbi:caspase [Fusarium pseudocircinatum]|uniref:Caspase n=1 Tax=Fusarium pseudocircinatum TaxID=56676 RepID=A0A8H5KYG0_9HYPO|nr:caspase [Fusarium pseudocircinatum]
MSEEHTEASRGLQRHTPGSDYPNTWSQKLAVTDRPDRLAEAQSDVKKQSQAELSVSRQLQAPRDSNKPNWPRYNGPLPEGVKSTSREKHTITRSNVPQSIYNKKMASSNVDKSQNRALLIGIRDYPYPLNPLPGAVKDVENQARWLTEKNIVPESNIVKIISNDTNGLQPTYQNILKEFQKLIKEAQPGSFIFVHFSGHGSQRTTVLDTARAEWKAGKDELLLFKDGYMRDFEFREILDQLGKNGRVVFAVLDCCHSGGIDRDDEPEGQVIYREVPESQTDGLCEHEYDKKVLDKWNNMESDWWKNPRTYTLLAACEEGMRARDTPEGGYLTTSLLSVLQSTLSFRWANYRRLQRILAAEMKRHNRDQTPIILGLSDRTMFTADQFYMPEVAYVDKVINSGTGVRIDLGRAHFVQEKSKYQIFPRDYDSSQGDPPLATVSVSMLGGLFSQAEIPEEVSNRISQGCIARPVDMGFTTIVGMSEFLKKETDYGSLESTLKNCDEPTSLLKIEGNDTATPQFFLDVQNGEYEILDGERRPIRFPHLPPIKCQKSDAAQLVHQSLHRMVHFNRVWALKNESTYLNQRFKFFAADTTEGRNIDVKDEGRVMLNIENTSHESLHYCLLNLRPMGEIKQLLPHDATGTENLPPGAKHPLPIIMSIPTELKQVGVKNTKSIFKLFVANRRSFFHMHQTPEFLVSEDERSTASWRNGEIDFSSMKDMTAMENDNWTTAEIVVNIEQQDNGNES